MYELLAKVQVAIEHVIQENFGIKKFATFLKILTHESLHMNN